MLTDALVDYLRYFSRIEALLFVIQGTNDQKTAVLRINLAEKESARINVIRPSIKTEIFVCDECGVRKRLKTASRHWCDCCHRGSPVEMRPARDKRVVHPRRVTTAH